MIEKVKSGNNNNNLLTFSPGIAEHVLVFIPLGNSFLIDNVLLLVEMEIIY